MSKGTMVPARKLYDPLDGHTWKSARELVIEMARDRNRLLNELKVMVARTEWKKATVNEADIEYAEKLELRRIPEKNEAGETTAFVLMV